MLPIALPSPRAGLFWGGGAAVVPQINRPLSRKVITPDIVSKPAEMLPSEFVAPVAVSPAEAWHSQQ